jgi:hypothetical protein
MRDEGNPDIRSSGRRVSGKQDIRVSGNQLIRELVNWWID